MWIYIFTGWEILIASTYQSVPLHNLEVILCVYGDSCCVLGNLHVIRHCCWFLYLHIICNTMGLCKGVLLYLHFIGNTNSCIVCVCACVYLGGNAFVIQRGPVRAFYCTYIVLGIQTVVQYVCILVEMQDSIKGLYCVCIF